MKRSGLIWGILLVLAGLFAIAVQWLDLGAESVVLLLGIGFFVVYIATRKTGWVIPAMLLICIGAGVLLTERMTLMIPEGTLIIALLALAFFLMHPFVYRKQGNWPLFPGVTLMAVAVIVYMSEDPALAATIWALVDAYWPVALIVAGVWVIITQAVRPRHKPEYQWQQGGPGAQQAYQGHGQQQAYQPPPQTETLQQDAPQDVILAEPPQQEQSPFSEQAEVLQPLQQEPSKEEQQL